MFQGGFVARQCDICVRTEGSWTSVHSLFPADINALQSFDLPESMPAEQEWAIYFRQPTDFYGRITLYRLRLYA